MKPTGFKRKADYVLDFRETITPLALLKMTHILREMKTNQILEIIARDPDTRTDLFKVLPPSSCELLDMEFCEKKDCYRIQLKKIRYFWP